MEVETVAHFAIKPVEYDVITILSCFIFLYSAPVCTKYYAY